MVGVCTVLAKAGRGDVKRDFLKLKQFFGAWRVSCEVIEGMRVWCLSLGRGFTITIPMQPG